MSRGLKTFAGDGVALTFDDGPHPVITPQVLDILDAARAVATFFVVGERVDDDPGLAREIARRGHALGNHTQTHRNLLLLSARRTSEEIRRCQKTVGDATATTPAVFRAPWGKLTRAARRECAAQGLVAYDWTIDPEGWPRPHAVDTMTAVALSAARPGAIIDLHDVPWFSEAGLRCIQALPAILAGLEERGLNTVVLPGVRAAAERPAAPEGPAVGCRL